MVENFDVAALRGLTEAEAAARLEKVGPNELPSAKRRLAIAFEVVTEPMFLLLVAGGVIYLLLGDPREALMLLGFVVVVLSITIYQERTTERALEALRDLTSPRALVIRDGQQRRIAGREVVPGDLVVLAEGDRVPADAEVLWCLNLAVDESLLTGEAVPVRKVAREPQAGDTEEPTIPGRPGGDDSPFVFSGTLVVQGRIGKALTAVEPEETPLQKETGRLVRTLATGGLALCAVVVVVYGLTRGDWLTGLLARITLAMAVLPEEFPLVLTVFLALGAWRLSRKRVLTRRVPAVETLGAATVLCVDKTGTLILNRMSVSRLFAGGEFHDMRRPVPGPLPEAFHQLITGSWRARSTRSTRWKRRCGSWGSVPWPRLSTCAVTGRWCRSIPFPGNSWPCLTSGSPLMGRSTSSPSRALRKPSPTSATSPPRRWPGSRRRSRPWPPKDCESLEWPRRAFARLRCRMSSTTSGSSPWGWWTCPTRSGRMSRLRFRNVTRRESGS